MWCRASVNKKQKNKRGKNKMNKCNMGGHDFYYEQICFGMKGGASVFAVKDVADAKEYDLYWVVLPVGKQDWEKGCSTPKDGRVVCMCKEEIDANMIAASINIARDLATKIEHSDTYDTDAMAKEIRRLHSEGKSDAEILNLMKDKRDTFLRKKPTEPKKNGSEW